MSKARFAHVNLVAADWRKLAGFYVDTFGCAVKPPERNLRGKWLDELTAVKNAGIRGIHLHLPGYGKTGPTLEIFQYEGGRRKNSSAVNRPGFAHIAFAVSDVRKTLERLERNGGSRIGRLISTRIEGAGSIEVVYARDPEGNIIELQKWGSK